MGAGGEGKEIKIKGQRATMLRLKASHGTAQDRLALNLDRDRDRDRDRKLNDFFPHLRVWRL